MGGSTTWYYDFDQLKKWGQNPNLILDDDKIHGLGYSADYQRANLGTMRIRIPWYPRATRTARVTRFSTFGNTIIWGQKREIAMIHRISFLSGPSKKEELGKPNGYDFFSQSVLRLPSDLRAPFQPRVWSERTWEIFWALEDSMYPGSDPV